MNLDTRFTWADIAFRVNTGLSAFDRAERYARQSTIVYVQRIMTWAQGAEGRWDTFEKFLKYSPGESVEPAQKIGGKNGLIKHPKKLALPTIKQKFEMDCFIAF